jgi:protein-tyrosine phosphatase
MIDTHCHILPGLDDGASDTREAVAMARRAVADGIHTIIATPHWTPSPAAPSPAALREAAGALQRALAAEGLSVRLEAGAEVALVPDLLPAAQAGELPTLAGSEYLLVEMLPYGEWDLVRRLIFELQLGGYKIVLAHPERVAALHENYRRAAELRAAGVRLQICVGNLLGRAGASLAKMARRLVRDGLADLLASDAHDAQSAPPVLSPARSLVTRLAGPSSFDRLTRTGPQLILAATSQQEIGPPPR